MSPRRLEVVLVVALAVVAVWLRIADLRLMEFKADEAETLRLAAIIVRSHVFPTAGLETSLGGHTGPLLHELAALTLLFSRDPVVVTALVIALPGAAAVVLTYFVLRRRFGRFVALVSALLFAVSPWAVLYSRKLWPQSLFPLPVVGLLHCVLTLRERPQSRIVAAVPLLLAVIGQLQLSSLALALVIAAFLLPKLRILDRRALLLGCAGGILVAAPYLVHFVRGHGDELRMASSRGLEPGAKHSLLDPAVLTLAISGDTSLDYAIGGSVTDWQRNLLARGASVTFSILALAGLGLCVFAIARRNRSALGVIGGWILLYWGICIVAAAAGLHLWPHYFIVLYPLPFLLVALALDALRARGTAAGIAATLLVAWIAVADLVSMVRMRDFLRANQGTGGDYGVVYATKARLAAWAAANELSIRDGSPREFRVLVELARTLRAPLDANPIREVAVPPEASVDVYPNLADPSPYQCLLVRRFGPLLGCVR